MMLMHSLLIWLSANESTSTVKPRQTRLSRTQKENELVMCSVLGFFLFLFPTLLAYSDLNFLSQPQGQNLDEIVVSVPQTPAHGAVARLPSQVNKQVFFFHLFYHCCTFKSRRDYRKGLKMPGVHTV